MEKIDTATIPVYLDEEKTGQEINKFAELSNSQQDKRCKSELMKHGNSSYVLTSKGYNWYKPIKLENGNSTFIGQEDTHGNIRYEEFSMKGYRPLFDLKFDLDMELNTRYIIGRDGNGLYYKITKNGSKNRIEGSVNVGSFYLIVQAAGGKGGDRDFASAVGGGGGSGGYFILNITLPSLDFRGDFGMLYWSNGDNTNLRYTAFFTDTNNAIKPSESAIVAYSGEHGSVGVAPIGSSNNGSSGGGSFGGRDSTGLPQGALFNQGDIVNVNGVKTQLLRNIGRVKGGYAEMDGANKKFTDFSDNPEGVTTKITTRLGGQKGRDNGAFLYSCGGGGAASIFADGGNGQANDRTRTHMDGKRGSGGGGGAGAYLLGNTSGGKGGGSYFQIRW